MLIGQVLIKPLASPTPAGAYFSPWFPSGGNEILATVDVMAILGASGSEATGIEIFIETKISEQDDAAVRSFGPFGGAGGFAIGRSTFTAGTSLSDLTASSGLLELVRYRYEIVGGAGGVAGIHFRMLNPTWLSH
jgi:hypothetical protein